MTRPRRPTPWLTWSLTFLAVLLVVVGAISGRAQSASPALKPGASSLAELGVLSTPASPPTEAVSIESAVGTAREAFGDAAQAPGVKASAQFVLLTDESTLGSTAQGDSSPIENLPVWLVHLEGLSIPSTMRPGVVHTEYWVIVDGATGEYLEAFSYR